MSDQTLILQKVRQVQVSGLCCQDVRNRVGEGVKRRGVSFATDIKTGTNIYHNNLLT